MKTIQKTVYVAEDFSEFTKEEDCIKHEKELIEKEKFLDGLQIHKVAWSFEATEGRGYYNQTNIISELDCFSPEILQYCYKRYGAPLRGWYGKDYYQEWRLYTLKILDEDKAKAVSNAISQNNTNRRDTSLSGGKIDTVFISKKDLGTDELEALRVKIEF